MKLFRILLLILVTLCTLHGVMAQPIPQYELSVQNPVLTGTTYQFDLYVKRLGVTNWRLGNSQFILTFNAGSFLAPAISRVVSSEQTGTGFFFDQIIAGNQLRISLGGNGSYASATDIGTTGSGTRISTFRITGVNVPVLSAGLTWVNLPSLIRTGISEINASDNYRDITDQTGASHIPGGGEFARFSGYKFEDLNGNGIWNQPAEQALNGWTINLTGPGGPLAAISGSGAWATGYFEFVNLTPGNYTVSEVTQPGWSQTSGPPASFTLAPGQNSQNNNFGNFNGPTLRGTVFNDLNGDSSRTPGEPGLAGWQIVATQVGGSGLKSQNSGISGDYAFTFLPTEVGSWQISQTPQSGWIQTFPNVQPVYTVLIQSGSAVTGIDFGDFQAGVIGGLKFNDFNRDSLKAPFEPGLPGWKIRLARNGVPFDSVLTDPGGNYQFQGLATGTYTVTEESVPGWIRTIPAGPGSYTIPIAIGGISAVGRNFGNYHPSPYGGPGDISGTVFEDANADSIRQIGDFGVSGWKIYLSVGPTVLDSVLTDVNGFYQFSSLVEGLYTISEINRPEWTRTYPAPPGAHQVLVTSVHLIWTGVNFGEYNFGSIGGISYQDQNHNGMLDSSDVGYVGLTIDVVGPSSMYQIVTGPGGNWSLGQLMPGLYTITERVPLGMRLTQPVPGFYAVNITSGARPSNLHFGISSNVDTLKYRTLSYDSLAASTDNLGKLMKSVRRKADKVEFCKVFTNLTGYDVDGIKIRFHYPAYANDPRYPFVVYPPPMSVTFDPAGQWVDIRWAVPIHDQQNIQVCGWGKKASYQQLAVVYWTSGGAKVGSTDLAQVGRFYVNSLRLPMPNPLNVVEETFLRGGYGASGLVTGVERPDLPKSYGWVKIRSIANFKKSLIDKSVTHTILGHGFDYFFSTGRSFVKQQKSLSPFKQNNRLFADLLTLKVNIVASQLQIFRAGIGEMIYSEGSNPLNGLTVAGIAARADTALTYWQGRLPAEFVGLDSVIRKINAAFDGPMDTLSFGSRLICAGARRLEDIPFLRANPAMPPKTIEGTVSPELEPQEFALCQNYPNPFNPSTTIQFEIPVDQNVTIRIYNLLGQEMVTLLEGEPLEAGVHEVEFVADNLPSGTYFYRITAGDFTAVKKMILLK